MSLVISDRIIRASGMSEAEFMTEIAIMLFEQEKVSIGKASRIASMNQIEFQRLLARRDICIHYDVADFQEELRHLREKGWL